MPYLHLTLGRPLAAEHQRELARRATELLAQGLGKRGELTAVRIECTADAWFIGGLPIPAQSTPCHGELLITADTNDDAEKAAFLAALQALLAETCGPLPTASYLVIHEIPAANWGYDGQTQAARAGRGRTASR